METETARVRVEPAREHVRVTFAGEVIADSTHALVLHETGHAPVYYFPRSDVRFDLLTPTDLRTRCPFKGWASYWSIVVGDQTSANAVWGYPEPIPECPDIRDYVAFYRNRVEDLTASAITAS
jgi:uncharacterized protein (DUF427 family)